MPRTRIGPSALLSAILLGTPAARAQDCNPPMVACTPGSDLGIPGLQGDSVTDLTYRADLHQVWVIEAPLPGFNSLTQTRITIYNEDLSTGRRSINGSFPEFGIGIGEIPAGFPNGGKCFVLGIDPAPSIAIMDDDGALLPNPTTSVFQPVIDPRTGLPPPGFFTALDVHPTSPEMVLLDSKRDLVGMNFVFVDFDYQVIRGPFHVEGLRAYFGGGICYTNDNTVLVTAPLYNRFETHLALEYSLDGVYTGRTLDLGAIDRVNPVLANAIDLGSSANQDVIFLCNLQQDAAYALPYSSVGLDPSPGPVGGLAPICGILSDGRAQLVWTNNPAYQYDSIAVLENEVQIASLAPTETEYTSASPVCGKVTYCLETRLRGAANVVRACCETQSATIPSILPAADVPASRVDVDDNPQYNFEQFGLACPPVVATKEDFRMYVVGSYDNQVRVVDYQRRRLPLETISTDPPRSSTLSFNSIIDIAVTGIALLNMKLEGQEGVALYALLDGDGAPDASGVATFVPRGSVHYLRDVTLPSGFHRAGSRIGGDMVIDFSIDLNSPRLVLGWDSEATGGLITFDSEGRKIRRIRFDPVAGTLRNTAFAPLPLESLTPFTGLQMPLGQLSVLASGNYLVTGGSTFDTTINKAYLLTPLVSLEPGNPDRIDDIDPDRSCKLVGMIEGLWSFSQLNPIIPTYSLGVGIGPGDTYGLETVFFSQEGEGGLGMVYYSFPNYYPIPTRYVIGNLLTSLGSDLPDPVLLADQVLDATESLDPSGVLQTNAAGPSFANQVGSIDYHYHVFNPSTQDELHVGLAVLLGGEEEPALAEADLTIPPGRSLYRRASGRAEKTIQLSLRNLNQNASREVRLLIGATGKASSQPIFRRGDADDDGKVGITDAIVILNFLFLGGAEPPCLDAVDIDDTGRLEVTDPVRLLNFLFLGGDAPLPPGPVSCGPDPSDDPLKPCQIQKSCP